MRLFRFKNDKPSTLFDEFDHRWLYLAVAAHLCAAWFGEGFFQPDEHFQILETLNFLLGRSPVEDLPWEFDNAMRPSLIVVAAFSVARVLEFAGVYDPHLVAGVLRFAAAALGLAASLMLIRAMADEAARGDEDRRRIEWAWIWTCALWVLPIQHARYSAEGLSGSLFFIGAALLLRRRLPWAGLALAAALMVRPHTAPLVAGLGVWWLYHTRPNWRQLLAFTTSAAAVAVAEVLAARWIFGEWAFTPWNYAAVTILADRLSYFAAQPWWGYVPLLIDDVVTPFNLLFLTSVVGFCWLRPRHWLTWSTVPFLLLHMAIGHKELRFLFPLVTALPLMIAVTLPLTWPRVQKTLVVLSVVLMVGVLRPFNPAPAFARAVAELLPRGARIYTLDKDPFSRLGLNLNFYRTVPIEVVHVADAAAIREDEFLLFHHRIALPGGFDAHRCSLLYSALPEWVEAIDINDWQRRSEVWRLYRCAD